MQELGGQRGEGAYFPENTVNYQFLDTMHVRMPYLWLQDTSHTHSSTIIIVTLDLHKGGN